MQIAKTDFPATRIQSVTRAARILLYLAEEREGRTAKEIANAQGLAAPTAYHLLTTLLAEGLLVKDSSRRYQLGPKIGALSDAFLSQATPPEYLLTGLRQLAQTTGETGYLSGWRGGEIVVFASVEGSRAVRVSGLHSGFQAHAHARASGKLLLAFARPDQQAAYLQTHKLEPLTPHTIIHQSELLAELARIRERGYATDEEEFAEGVACISAPIIESGTPIAAYTLAAPTERYRTRQQELTNAVLTIAHSVRSEAERTATHTPTSA